MSHSPLLPKCRYVFVIIIHYFACDDAHQFSMMSKICEVHGCRMRRIPPSERRAGKRRGMGRSGQSIVRQRADRIDETSLAKACFVKSPQLASASLSSSRSNRSTSTLG